MSPLDGVEYCSQYEECRKAGRKPCQHEILYEVCEIALEVGHPSCADAAIWQRRWYSERGKPADELRQSKEDDRPEHPFRKVPTDECVGNGPLPQAESRPHQADDGCGWSKQQHHSHEVRD